MNQRTDERVSDPKKLNMSTSSPASSPGGSSSSGVSPLLHHRNVRRTQHQLSQEPATSGHHLSPSQVAQNKKLSRRWSLDNLNDTFVEGGAVGGVGMREGYVRDLRKQHQSSLTSIKDEEYPYMLSGGEEGAAVPPQFKTQLSPKKHVKGARRILNQRGRSGSMELTGCGFGAKLGQKPNHRLHGRLVSKSPFSSSVDISVVPEDNVIAHVSSPGKGMVAGKRSGSPGSISPSSSSTSGFSPSKVPLETKSGAAKAFLRQRSSSLPRILPPIFDQDTGEVSGERRSDSASQQQERQSTVVAREMQKFVCRQAIDVSTLLPLPFPTNWRQGKALFKLNDNVSASPNSSPCRKASLLGPLKRRKQLKLLISNVAKVHGIFLVIKQTSPNLYSEFLATLRLDVANSNDREQEADTQAQEESLKILQADSSLSIANDNKLQGQLASLTSMAALPFSVITLGMLDLDRIVFRYQDDRDRERRASVSAAEEPIGLCLSGFNSCSRVGSPLLDIYSILLQACQLEDFNPDSGFFSLMLQEYHSTLARTNTLLRNPVGSLNLTLQELTEDVKAYFSAGAVLCLAKEISRKKSAVAANGNSETKTPASEEEFPEGFTKSLSDMKRIIDGI